MDIQPWPKEAGQHAMDDFSRYEAMREAGATPQEVGEAAWQDLQDSIMVILVLRSVCGLSLADAVQVLRQVRPLPPAEGSGKYFTMFVIDPGTRAPARFAAIDEFARLEVLQTIMARCPDIDRDGLLSWGHVTRAELEALIQADHLWLDDEMTAYPPERFLWSLCYGRH